VLLNVVVLLVALLVATGLGVAWRRANGHFRGAAPSAEAKAAAERAALPERETAPVDDLPGPLGERATLLQFSSAFCAPCRSTRRILADVAAVVPGVVHIEVDAEHHLELVRRLGVRRTPMTFVLDADGGIVVRAAGAPSRAAVLTALEQAVEAPAGPHRQAGDLD
jgi:thiol-disulfide isomerase/thioredoxin